MKVLLLGATGNVGSRLAPALLAHKHEVVAIVRSESKLQGVLPSAVLSAITVIQGDATNAASIRDVLVSQGCDALINSAGQASIFPWQAPRMQDIINAVATAAVEASTKLGHPIRGWFLGPQERLRWSLLCPSVMTPVNKTVALPDGTPSNPLVASADIPPGWTSSWLNSIPFLGPLVIVLVNAPRYNIKLEDCADFMAADLEKVDSEFIGHRVGLRDSGNGKTS
ncbi:hypothetical protein ACLMJK_002527 [Lecanora helva]